MFLAKFFCCLREFLGAAGFTWAGLDVAAGTKFTISSLAQGSLEGWGICPDMQNARSLGGQRMKGRSEMGPVSHSEKIHD